MHFRPNPSASPLRDPLAAPQGRHLLRLVGLTAVLGTVLAVSACGSQKALTPPATPPTVAAPTSTTTTVTPYPSESESLGQTLVTGDSTPTTSATSTPSEPTSTASTTSKKASPTTTAKPKASTPAATQAGNKAPATAAVVTGCGNPNPSKVLLTFDDGGPKAPAILAVLDRYGIKARWFPTGQWAAANASFMSKLVAGGQMTGNHSYSHPQMLSSLGTAELTRQVNLGYRPTKVFRFPYGASDATSRGIVSGLGYSICGWSIDTLDWKGNSTETITNIVTSQARPGAVVLMHQSFQTDVDALPTIIENLRGRGLI